MQNITILKKNKNMVTRKIADETILLPIYKTSKEINCIYTLNKPASIVWDMIDGKTTVGEIKDKVLDNGFDLIKDKGLRIKNSAGKKKKLKAERERGVQRDALHASRDAREEVDSQLKVFFGELKEIKAVIRQKAQSDKGTQAQRGKARSNNEDGRGKKRNTLHDSRTTKRGRRMKFRPEITRVKLNPEQAVLTCNCYNTGFNHYGWTTLESYHRFPGSIQTCVRIPGVKMHANPISSSRVDPPGQCWNPLSASGAVSTGSS